MRPAPQSLDATHRHQPQVVARYAVAMDVCLDVAMDVATDVAKLIDQRIDRRHARTQAAAIEESRALSGAFAQQIGQLGQGIAQDVDATDGPCRTEPLIDPREHTAGEVAA